MPNAANNVIGTKRLKKEGWFPNMEYEVIYHTSKNIQFPFYEAKSGLSVLPTMNTMTETNASHEVL